MPELILAVSLLGMVVAMILLLFPFSQRFTASANHYWLAQDFLRTHLEQTTGLDFDTMHGDLWLDYASNITYTCQVTVQNYGTDTPPMLKTVTGTVQWNDGSNQCLKLSTLVVRTYQ
ncbi:MAG: hypothetical protein ACYCW6_02110 [Candidatus Xenobia bacterium]